MGGVERGAGGEGVGGSCYEGGLRLDEGNWEDLRECGGRSEVLRVEMAVCRICVEIVFLLEGFAGGWVVF